MAYDDFGKAGKGDKVGDVQKMLNYFYSDAAQGQLASIGYAALPTVLRDKAAAKVATLK